MTDGDSMITNNLRYSANATFVTLDDSSHFTDHGVDELAGVGGFIRCQPQVLLR